MLLSLQRVLSWSLMIGGVAFFIGFFGPMILAPDANQGPLLGILITGPLGLVGGLLVGLWREAHGHTTGPLALLASSRPEFTGELSQWAQPLAALVGVMGVIYGFTSLRYGGGRGAAASILVATALLYYAVTGRAPRWFRR